MIQLSEQEKYTFNEFCKEFSFQKYLYNYQIRIIYSYINKKIPDRNWFYCRELFKYFLSSVEGNEFFNVLADLCKWKLHPDEEKQIFKATKQRKRAFFKSLRSVIAELLDIDGMESGLSRDKLSSLEWDLRTLFATQKKYYREEDGSPLPLTSVQESNDQIAHLPEKVYLKPDLTMILLLFKALKKGKHPSRYDRELVARLFLFWKFNESKKKEHTKKEHGKKKEDINYEESKPKNYEIENELSVSNYADRLTERYKKNLNYKKLVIYDPSTRRYKVLFEKRKKQKGKK